jgi:uncharacterized membrane protein
MVNLVIASLFLPLSHFLISSTPLRALLRRLLGARVYSLGYSLLAAVALVWLVRGYRHAPVLPLWNSPPWVGLAYADHFFQQHSRGGRTHDAKPCHLGIGEAVRTPGHRPRGLARDTKSFLLGREPVFRRARHHPGRRRSNPRIRECRRVPFLAIMQGRQQLLLHEFALWWIALGIGVFLGALVLHPTLFGGNPLGSF